MCKKSYFRPAVDAMLGYVPGDQPKLDKIIKLNTNENPYPPSPRVQEALNGVSCATLRRYPDPTADRLREVIAALHGVERANVIAGNGSDDILTIAFRAFTSPELPLACLDPTYSLYTDLAAMQEAKVIKIPLSKNDFAPPADLLERATGANLLIITRPNAPTGTTFPLETAENIVQNFDGMVMFDEAYADFAPDNCMALATRYPNVIVMRTLSKSYALAGMRIGYAVATEAVIKGMMKLKDSYNLDSITQLLAAAALSDRDYFAEHVKLVRASRGELVRDLTELGFFIPDSEGNFLFARPPQGDGRGYFEFLKSQAIFVRYFNSPGIDEFVRITIGTPEELAELVTATKEYLAR